MRKYILFFTVVIFSACSSNNEPNEKDKDLTKSSILEQSDTLLSKNDDAADLDTNALSFLQNAGYGGMVEVESSSKILTKTESPVVKTFAEMMVKDHTAVNVRLKALAEKKGYKLPVSLPMSRVDLINKMDEFKEEGRNEYYVQLMINEHIKAVNVFSRGTRSKDPDIKKFSTEILPTLKHHYNYIKKADTLIQAPKANQGDDPIKISDRYNDKKN